VPDDIAVVPAARPAVVDRVRAASETALERHRLAFLNLSLAVLSLAITVVNRPGEYVGDFRFEVAWDPSQTLRRLPSIWQTAGGLGGVAGTDRSPLPTAFFGIARSLGAEPWLAQRLWHALLFTLAGTGMVQLVRFYRPRVGLWHLVAGLTYLLSPVGLGLLLPSPIYAVFAVAPWIFSSLVFGATGREPWRWAAIFALALLLVAPVEMPATAYVLAFLLPLAIVLVHVERVTSWRRVGAWVVRAGTLAAVCLSFVVVRTLVGRGSLERRLQITETPEVIARTTSWAEAFRGLGHWQVYFDAGLTVPKPNLAAWLDTPVVIAATILLPMLALATLFRRGWLPARYFTLIGLASLVLTVGIHPIDDPSPWGRLVEWLYDESPSSTAFRSTLKAAAPWAIAVALLFGAAVDRARSFTPNRFVRGAVPVAALVLIGTISWPVWSGNLYPPSTLDEVPEYWTESIEWLDDEPGGGAALILPGTASARYRWGDPGDDIFQASLHRSFVVPTVFATSTPSTTDIVYEIQTQLESASGNDTLAPVLRRLGVRFVVLRNDLVWEEGPLPRPVAFEDVRTDPELDLVATFGETSENTSRGPTLPFDDVERGFLDYEERLRPIEIYEVQGADQVRASAPAGETLLVGDGEGWFRLGALGLLDTDWPIRYVDASTDDDLIEALEGGAALVVTDTNGRRQVSATNAGASITAPLFSAQSLDRPDALFPEVTSQTVAWMRDASLVSTTVESFREPWYRPSQAFDGDTSTQWRVPPFADASEHSMSVLLREPGPVGSVTITGAEGSRQVTSGYVRIDDGEATPFSLTEGRASIDFGGTVANEVTVGILAVAGSGGDGPGYSEVDIEGFDLRPARRVPDDLFRRASQDSELGAALAETPLAFVFERETSADRPPTESDLRRLFTIDRPRTFDATGNFSLGPDTVITDGCVSGVLVDGRAAAMRPIALPDAAGVAPFESCEPVELAAGEHELETDGTIRLDRVALRESAFPEPEQPKGAVPVTVVSQTSTELVLTIDAPAGGTEIVTGLAYDPGWRATVDGESVEIHELDAQVGVRLTGTGVREIQLRFGPQRAFGAALLLSIAGLVACLGLLVWPRRAGVTTSMTAVVPVESRPTAAVSSGHLVVLAVVLVVVFLGAGWTGLVLALSAIGVGYGFGWYVPTMGGMALLLVAGLATLFEATPEVSFDFAIDRPSAASAARLGMSVLAAVAAAPASLIAPRSTMGVHEQGGGSPRVARSSIVAAAAIGAMGAVGAVVAWIVIDVPGGDLGVAIERLQTGTGLNRALSGLSDEVTAGALPAWLGAYGPFGLRVLAAASVGAGAAAAAASTVRARRRVSPMLGPFVAALGIPVLALVAGTGGSDALAVGLLAIGSFWLTVPTVAAGALAGVFFGLAVLVGPEPAAAAVLLTAIAGLRRDAPPTRRVACLTVTALSALAWWRWLAATFGADVIVDAVRSASVLRYVLVVGWLWLWSGDRSIVTSAPDAQVEDDA